MKNLLLFCAFLKVSTLPLLVSGQTISISGHVTDSAHRPLPSAIVSLTTIKSGNVIAYGLSDRNGYYTIHSDSLFKGDSLIVTVNTLQYRSVSKCLIHTNEIIDFVVNITRPELPDVVVKNNNRPVRRNRDTINYIVDSFTYIQDRSIGDVLKRMPGLDVDDRGKISFNGKPIFNLYIDGDNLLDDKYNVATKGIKADMVSRVQVIENDQPIKILQKRTLSENVSLNLQLKEEAKLRILGEADLATGTKGNDIALTQMLFANRVKTINKVNYNDIGIDLNDEITKYNVFTEYKKYDFIPLNPLLNVTSGSAPDLGKDRYLFNKAGLVNFNNLYKTKGDIQLRLNLSGYWDSQAEKFNTLSKYYLPSDTAIFFEDQASQKKLSDFTTQLTIVDNKESHYLSNTFVMKFDQVDQYSSLHTSTKALIQSLNRNGMSYSNDLSILKRAGNNTIFEISSVNKYNQSPEMLVVSPGIGERYFTNNMPYSSLTQSATIPTFFSNNGISFQVSSGQLQQSYKIGFIFQSQVFHSAMLFSGAIPVNVDSTKNEYSNKRFIPYIRADYLLVKRNWQLGLAIPLYENQLTSDGIYGSTSYKSRKLYLNPGAQLKFFIGLENYISINYQHTKRFGQISDVYNSYIFQNFQLLSANTVPNPESNSRVISVGFTGRRTAKILFYNLTVSANRGDANYITSTNYYAGIQSKNTSLFNNTTSSLSFTGGISKYIFALHSTISLNSTIQQSNGNLLQNTILFPYTSIAKTLSAKLSSRLKAWISLAVMASLLDNKTDFQNSRTGNNNEQRTQQIHFNCESTISPMANLSIQGKVENFYFYQFQNAPGINNFFSDVFINFRLKKIKADCSLALKNIGNIQSYHTAYTSINNSYSSDYAIRPRMVLVRAVFNF